LIPQENKKMTRAYIIAGLAFGDEGKGSVVDFLCSALKAKLVVRYNGGPQCAHNVVTPDGMHHTFSLFGSGTFAGADTYLSAKTLIDPFSLLNEADILSTKGVNNPLSHIHINPDCVVITPYHRLVNQIQETMLRRGSCGVGLGNAREDELTGNPTLRVRNLRNPRFILDQIRTRKLTQCRQPQGTKCFELYDKMIQLDSDHLIEQYKDFDTHIRHATDSIVNDYEQVIFEGGQGVLLDESYGTSHYNTWTDTTFRNASLICKEQQMKNVQRIAVVRTFFTRHGNGPFPTEINNRPPHYYPIDKYNADSAWQGTMRYGHFDAVLARYALRCLGDVDSLAVTHTDSDVIRISDSYRDRGGRVLRDVLNLECIWNNEPIYTKLTKINDLAKLLQLPIGLISTGPSREQKKILDL
jgi:adenylosuccinate synthase